MADMDIPAALYTRQQVAELTGVADDVLSFWIKNDLLVPTSGGQGKGSHRKFDFFQVNIAAVLAELRRFGVNIGIMRELASQLQQATALAKSAECNFWALNNAVDLASALIRFREGDPIDVLPDMPNYWSNHPGFDNPREAGAYHDSHMRPAKSEEEIMAYMTHEDDEVHDLPERIIAFAQRLSRDDFHLIKLFTDLNNRAYLYVWDGRAMAWGDLEWIVVPLDDGKLQVFSAPERHNLLEQSSGEVRSGLFLAPGTIVRGVWGDNLQPIIINEPTPSEWLVKRRRQAEDARVRWREPSRKEKVA